jgi:hypothetical protein
MKTFFERFAKLFADYCQQDEKRIEAVRGVLESAVSACRHRAEDDYTLKSEVVCLTQDPDSGEMLCLEMKKLFEEQKTTFYKNVFGIQDGRPLFSEHLLHKIFLVAQNVPDNLAEEGISYDGKILPRLEIPLTLEEFKPLFKAYRVSKPFFVHNGEPFCTYEVFFEYMAYHAVTRRRAQEWYYLLKGYHEGDKLAIELFETLEIL